MRLWYRIIDNLFSYYWYRLQRDIPYEVFSLFVNYKIYLYEVRFNRCVLSVEQVDSVLNHQQEVDPKLFDYEQRIFIKNILLQNRLLEEGYKYSADSNITGVQHHPELSHPRIWKRNPVIPEKSSYPYSEVKQESKEGELTWRE